MIQSIPTLDLIAVAAFLGLWVGYTVAADHYTAKGRSLSAVMGRHRLVWMRSLCDRDNRVADTAIIGNLMRSVAFFASASHDLRQPLHAITLFSDVLASRLGDSEHGPLVKNIGNSVDLLESHFSQLLNISRIEAGVTAPELEDFDLQALVRRVYGEFLAEAARKGLRLRIHAPSLPVRSDPLLVARILGNLVSNAIRYTDQGSILVAARRRRGEASLEVWDTGIGIAPDRQRAVFEEFVQLGNPERDLQKGTGLGLAIVKRLAALLGHPLTMRSHPGRGTRFRLRLPLASPAASTEVSTASAIGDGDSNDDEPLVLVIDGAAEQRQQTCRLLENWGHRALPCADLAAAQAAAQGLPRPPDLIVGSCASDDEGRAAVGTLRSLLGQPVPAILAADGATPAGADAARSEAVYLMSAPLQPAKLRALVQAALQQPG